MNLERTLLLIKPDAVQRGLVGNVVSRLERTGLKIVGMKLMMISEALANKHYSEHVGKPFFETLVGFITSGPVVAMVLEGPGSITVTRKLMGATNPAEAMPGTIRGDYGLSIGMNIVHGSDSKNSAVQEITLFFDQDEIGSWSRAIDDWVVE